MEKIEYVLVDVPGPDGPRVHIEEAPVIGSWPDGTPNVAWVPSSPEHVNVMSLNIGADDGDRETERSAADAVARFVNVIDLAQGTPGLLRRYDRAGTSAVAGLCPHGLNAEMICDVWRAVDQCRARAGT